MGWRGTYLRTSRANLEQLLLHLLAEGAYRRQVISGMAAHRREVISGMATHTCQNQSARKANGSSGLYCSTARIAAHSIGWKQPRTKSRTY